MRKIAYTVDEAVAAGPIGRSKIYEAMRRGDLPAHKCGRRTFVLVEDFERYLKAQPPQRLTPIPRAN